MQVVLTLDITEITYTNERQEEKLIDIHSAYVAWEIEGPVNSRRDSVSRRHKSTMSEASTSGCCVLGRMFDVPLYYSCSSC